MILLPRSARLTPTKPNYLTLLITFDATPINGISRIKLTFANILCQIPTPFSICSNCEGDGMKYHKHNKVRLEAHSENSTQWVEAKPRKYRRNLPQLQAK